MGSFRSLLIALVVAMLATVALAEDPPAASATNPNHEMLRGADDAKPSGLQEAAAQQGALPSGLSLTGEQEALASPDGGNTEMFYGYRHRFFYPYFRGGYYGWRYPIGYWNLYGPRFYGYGGCPFGRYYGGWYYC